MSKLDEIIHDCKHEQEEEQFSIFADTLIEAIKGEIWRQNIRDEQNPICKKIDLAYKALKEDK